MSPPRKILFISADQWRAECLSVLGHPTVKTPHLDALAKDSVVFKRHFTVTAPCGPARASIHTGLYLMNHRSGRNGTPLDARHTNIAWEVRKIGLDPMLFGYTDTSADEAKRPLPMARIRLAAKGVRTNMDPPGAWTKVPVSAVGEPDRLPRSILWSVSDSCRWMD